MTVREANDTIVAIATAPGRAALAIVRASGQGVLQLARPLIRPWPESPRHATLAEIHDTQGEMLDECVVVFYQAPASFTGEDSVEITCHGGPIVAATIVAAMVGAGARPAEPGEFTRRAVLNGKLDLLQAEAVGDLVEAASRPSQRVALSQLDGGLSRRISALRERILELEALVAYDIDFPEEDDGPIPRSRILESASALVSDMAGLLSTAPIGEAVREGAVVVIAGAPNVGKSSLFNALLGRRRAIVTEVPGTTRDALEAVTEADGWPIRLVDTAGLRETSEVVERLGIEVSRDYLARADVVLICDDSQSGLIEATNAMSQLVRVPLIPTRTKADLAVPGELTERLALQVSVSAESGEGLRDLREAVAKALASAKGTLALDAPMITRERHRVALEGASNELRQFHSAFAEGSAPATVAAVHLHEATRLLEELIGAVDVEDVLDRLFSSFCVGK